MSVDLSTGSLGLKLKSLLVHAGTSAVVLPSVFEEQSEPGRLRCSCRSGMAPATVP